MQQNQITENHQRTYTGLYIDVFNPNPDSICIEDIAHALSMNCRWSGHIKDFFSVAQHSLVVTYLVPDDNKLKLQALMHDASEAYIQDIASPAKHRLPDYLKLEHNLMLAITNKFGFDYPLSSCINVFDKVALSSEWENLIVRNVQLPDDDILKPLQPKDAETKFLQTFYSLTL